MTATSGGSGRGRRSKVARLIDEYGLDSLGEKMEEAWTANDDRRRSLRELADSFNQKLLKRKLAEVGISSLDGEVENTYRLLTDDSVSTADQTRVRRRLERQEIDVDEVMDDFVSYQAIRTYLNKYREVDHAPEETAGIEETRQTIQQLRGRLATVSEDRIGQLDANDEIDIGTPDAIVDVQILCEDCSGQYSVTELLERGHCECV